MILSSEDLTSVIISPLYSVKEVGGLDVCSQYGHITEILEGKKTYQYICRVLSVSSEYRWET